MDQHINYRKHLDTLRIQIGKLKPEMRKDLLKMWNTLHTVYTELDKEAVNCRRLKRTTSTYKEIEAKLTTLFPSIEKRITLALLY